MAKLSKSGLLSRRFYRVSSNQPIEYRIMKYQKYNVSHLHSKRGFGLGKDLGEDGMSFITGLRLPEDMLLRLTLSLPDKKTENILARVVRCTTVNEGYLIAVQFYNFNEHRRHSIRSFVAEEAKKNYQFLKYL